MPTIGGFDLKTDAPIHTHDCEGCELIGHVTYCYPDAGTLACDVYVCDQGMNYPTVIIRSDSDGPEYWSGENLADDDRVWLPPELAALAREKMQAMWCKLEPGCYIDSHHGIYATPLMIRLGVEHGYILDPFEEYALARYETESGNEDYPFEAIGELSQDVEDWLNAGPNERLDLPLKGQNSPPAIPADHWWGWNDGDFGLYPEGDE